MDLDARRKYQREWMRKWRAANPEKSRESCRLWRVRYPEKWKESKRANRDKDRVTDLARYHRNKKQESLRIRALKYGITAEEFYSLLASQNHKCPGCDRMFTDQIKRGDPMTPRLDHNHSTGMIRGLLCNGCNLALGNVEDSAQRLRKLAEYLERSTTVVEVSA